MPTTPAPRLPPAETRSPNFPPYPHPATASTIYKAVGGGGSTTTTTFKERREVHSDAPDWRGGGVRGHADGGREEGGAAAGGDVAGRVDPKGGDAVPGGRKSEEEGRAKRGPPVGAIAQQTDGGGFTLKVGALVVDLSVHTSSYIHTHT